jgi:hypothetical protein
MTTVPRSKADRRAAMLSPYAAESQDSVERAMLRGVQPKGLDALVAWFREACHGEAPTALHKGGTWNGRQEYARRTGEPIWPAEQTGGSLMGSPATTSAFDAFISNAVDHPSATDDEGFYRLPLRAALARMGRGRYALTARYLYQLALMDGDVRRWAEQMCYPDEIASLYLERALDKLWREYRDLAERA